jgi:hypothetical protein
MTTLVEAKFGKQPMKGLADDLRRLADAVDAGQVVDLVATFVEDDSYCYLWATSLFDAVGITAMAHAQAIARMRETP